MNMSRLLLIDGTNVLRRIYAANQDPDSAEKMEQAVETTLRSLQRALRDHEPSHALAVFDHGGETWRHRLYPEYKAERSPAPAPLTDGVPGLLERIKRELGVTCLRLPDVEADDVLALVARRWLGSGRGPAIVLSTDKDLCQLVADGAIVYHHFARETRDAAWINAKFGIRAGQLTDFLALQGDGVDGIPGVPGIGPKSAARLLAEHGDLETILAKADSIGGAVGKKLKDHADLARLSRRLVCFATDMTLGCCWRDLAMAGERPDEPVAETSPATALAESSEPDDEELSAALMGQPMEMQ